MYEIIKTVNNYSKNESYQLLVDGYYHTTVSQKTIQYFKDNNISLSDSIAIEKYMKYHNM